MQFAQWNQRNQFAARNNGRQHRQHQWREGDYRRNDPRGYQARRSMGAHGDYANPAIYGPPTSHYYGSNGPSSIYGSSRQEFNFRSAHSANVNTAAYPPSSTTNNATALAQVIPGLPASIAPILASTQIDRQTLSATLQTLSALTSYKPVDEAERKRLAEEKEKERQEKEKREAKEHHVQKLYTGKQCASCGLRINAKDIPKHLDEHFEKNQRSRSAGLRSRGWFADDSNADNVEGSTDAHSKGSREKVETCASAKGEGESDDPCEMCREDFESRWNEDEEQWEVQNAVRVEGRAIHPECYKDKLKYQ